MIVKKCSFDPVKDIHDVDNFGYINLAEAYANGVVDSDINDLDLSYNEIDDPSTIVGKPRDIFETYSMMDYVKTYGKKESEPATPTNSVEQ